MPTKNERIGLGNDTEEVTAVKPPPPALILESKMVALVEPFPSGAPDEADHPTPPPVLVGALPARPTPARTPLARTTPARTAPARTTPARLVVPPPLSLSPAGLTRSSPAAPTLATAGLPVRAPSWPPRQLTNAISPPRPISPERAALLASAVPSPHAAVDLVPMKLEPIDESSFSGPLLAPTRGNPWRTKAPSRVGLYAVLIGLLAAGGSLVGWRQWWSVRPGRIEISTTPSGAVITVTGDSLLRRSPVVLEKTPGSYAISVAHEGYLRTERTVELHAGQEIMLTIALAPIGSADGKVALGAAETPGARAGAGAPATPHRFPTASPLAVHPAPPRMAAKVGPLPPLRHPLPAALRAMALAGSAPSETPEVINVEVPPPATASPAPPPTEPAPAAAPSSAPPAANGESPTASPSSSFAASAPAATGRPSARTIAGRLAKAQLIIDPNTDEYRVKLPPSPARADMKLSAVVKMCVSAEGKVTDVKLLKSADPAVDPQIRAVLGTWRYRPLLASGRAVPFCYVQQYEIASP